MVRSPGWIEQFIARVDYYLGRDLFKNDAPHARVCKYTRVQLAERPTLQQTVVY